jgi:hypothetical protein
MPTLPRGEDGSPSSVDGTKRRCRAAFAACQRYGGHQGPASPAGRAGSHRRQVRATSFSRAVPPRAISSGHQRYTADRHGHCEKIADRAAPPLTWGGRGRQPDGPIPWSALGPQRWGKRWTTMDRDGHQGIEENAAQPSCSFLTSGDARGRRGVRVSPPSCREPSGLLPTARWVTDDGPHPVAELGAVTARGSGRRSHRPCHTRATSSGHQRYAADSHGQSEEASGLGSRL